MSEILMHPASIVVLALAVATAAGRLLMWIGGVNEHKSEVSEFMREIRADIKKIFQRLPSKTLDRGSPVRLTALGDEVAKQIGARKWAVNQAGALRERVRAGLRIGSRISPSSMSGTNTGLPDSSRHS